MVVAPADHGTQADVIFVIEGTAINGAYMNDLKTNYVIPTLEYFSQGALEDYICESTSTLYGLVVYQAADCLPNPSSDCFGPYASPQKVLHMLDRIELIGGKGESHANIAEGLATALQCFEDLQQRRDSSCISQKHCILVCHSPPYQLPVVDSLAFAGNTVEQLANILAERGINLSVLSPRKIPALFKLYEKAGGDLQASQTKNYAKDPRHLVLLKGYNLKERPISPGPGSAPGPPHPTSLPLPSISSPLPSTGSPVAPPQAQTVFRPTQQASQVMGIAQPQQSQPQVSQQQQVQQQQQQVQQQVAQQQQVPQPVTQLQVVQQQQPQVQPQVSQQQQMTNQPQQVPTPSGPQGLGVQGRAPVPQSYAQQGPPSYIQMMPNRPPGPGRWPMLPPQRSQFPTPSSGSALIAQLTQPPSMGGPQFNILGQNPGALSQQQQANQQVQQQQAAQQAQQQQQQAQQQQANQQQPQSVQQQTNQQQQQSVQQQANQQPPQSVQQQAQQQQQQAQQQQSQQQQSQVPQHPGAMRMISQSNGPPGGLSMGGPQQSVPVSSSTGQPGQPGPPLAGRERQTIWQGVLEWIEKAKIPSDNQKQTRHVPCQVSANAKDGEPELKADNWPQKLIMQLMPKQLIGNIGGAYLKNSKSVLFHPQSCEALDSLTKVMSSGFAGCVHFTSVISPSACDIKVLILLYTAEKRAYLGFIPNDQVAFVDRLRKVIQHQKSTQAMIRQGQGGGGQPGVPTGPMNPGQGGNAMGANMGQQGGPLGGGMNPQQGGAGSLGPLGGPLGSQAPGQIGGLLNSQLQGLGGGMGAQQGSALSNALGGNPVGGGGQGGAGNNPGGGASGLMQAMAGVGNSNTQNQTPPQTPSGQQPPTSLGIQFPLQGSAAAAAAVAAAAAGQGGAPGGMMGQQPPFRIEAARQENLAKIQHLRKTLEQAQAQELQYKNQLEIISHMKIQQLQQSLEVAQQQEVQYKSQLEQEQQKQLRAQLQQMQQQRGMAPQQAGQGGPGGPAGGAQPGCPTAPQQQRMMRPGISNNPGLRHLLQQQQPQYRQQVLGMNPQQMPRTQQGMPNPQQSQQQFDENSFDFLT